MNSEFNSEFISDYQQARAGEAIIALLRSTAAKVKKESRATHKHDCATREYHKGSGHHEDYNHRCDDVSEQRVRIGRPGIA